MNKNFLIVFTEGKDKYNLEKQLKNFSECDIYRYNCKPDYDLLYENAKKAYEKGYESFYYLTESADWEELDKNTGISNGNGITYSFKENTKYYVEVQQRDGKGVYTLNINEYIENVQN